MNETNFYNEILNNNQKIVEYYAINPSDVIKLSKSKSIDALMLRDLANEFEKALNNEDLTLFNRTRITRTLIAIILAIKEFEKENEVKTTYTK